MVRTMTNSNCYSQYKTNQISYADQGKLILMMYDGAIQFINHAKNKLKKNDLGGMGLYLGKAESVISELSNTLNSKDGGNISTSLDSLYNFILKELFLAHVKKDPVILEKLTSILSKLREAWHQIYTKEEVKITSPEEVGENIAYHS